MPYKTFLDPEELTIVRWAGIILVLMLIVLFFCNWLNMGDWPF